MEEKKCSHCGEIKEFSEFYKRGGSPDGVQYWCKPCISFYAHWHQPRRVGYNKRYQQRIATRKRNQARIEALRAAADPRVVAGQRLRAAVSRGKIKKPSICSICEKEFSRKQIHGHHPDYNKPYLVIWCCPGCHKSEFHPRTGRYLDIKGEPRVIT